MIFLFKAMKYFIQYSCLFDSMNYNSIEGGYYSIVTTDDLHTIHDILTKMKNQLMETFGESTNSPRQFIAMFSEDNKSLVELNETLDIVPEVLPIDHIHDYLMYGIKSYITQFEDSENFPLIF